MRPPIILVLSRYPDIWDGFRDNVNELEPETQKILIRSGNLIFHTDRGWHLLHGPEPFVYSRSVNFGWEAADGRDVILCGDDIRFESTFVQELQDIAYSDDKVGIATVQLWGQSPFVCGYLKRDVIETVGPMDERFTGYGKDDSDWCVRMESLGFRTQPTETVKAKHGGGTSYLRRAKELGTSMEELCNTNNRLFEEKWR